MALVRISNKLVGENQKPFIIAEAGVNHDNNVEKAKLLIRKAAEAGADAIKFQTYTADTLVTKDAPRYWSKELDTDEGTTQYSAFKEMNALTKEDYKEIKKYADEQGIIFLSTPFFLEAVDLLEEIGVPAYKIASGDLTFHQLLRKIARTGKPIIMSVGASSIADVEESVKVIESEGNRHLIILHCMLSYPCDDKNANLKKIQVLKEKFPQYPIGYSDHTRGVIPPIAAMAMGAALVEKHYTLSRDSKEPSPDHRFAVNPEELKQICEASRIIKDATGEFLEIPYSIEQKAHELARRAVVAEKDIQAGQKITPDMLACKRAGKGLHPKHLDSLVGKRAIQDIPKDKIMGFDLVRMNNNRTIAIILARMGSSRFPGKVLMEINGTPILKMVYDRVNSCNEIDKTIIATSTEPQDDKIEEFCKQNNLEFFRGDEQDVLKRFYECAEKENKVFPVNAVVRVTADAPFVDPLETGKMIRFLLENNYDYLHNRHTKGPTLGLHAEAISFKTLKKINEEVTDKSEREHVTLHILKPENRNKFKIKLFDAPENLQRPQYRLLLDEKKDFQVISKICLALGSNARSDDIIQYLDNHPEIVSINKETHLDFKEILDK